MTNYLFAEPQPSSFLPALTTQQTEQQAHNLPTPRMLVSGTAQCDMGCKLIIVIVVISILVSVGILVTGGILIARYFRRRRGLKIAVIELSKDERIRKFVTKNPNKSNYALFSLESNCTHSELDTCGICLEELKGRVYRIDCGHHFHRSCLEQWAHERSSCPTCRLILLDRFASMKVTQQVVKVRSGSKRVT